MTNPITLFVNYRRADHPHLVYALRTHLRYRFGDEHVFMDLIIPPFQRAAGHGHVARVVRGGSWDDEPHFARVDYRTAFEPQSRGSRIGFRVMVRQR